MVRVLWYSANYYCGFAEELLLEDTRSYRYLSCGSQTVAALDDHELYRELIGAMDIMGISPEEQNGECACSSSTTTWTTTTIARFLVRFFSFALPFFASLLMLVLSQ